MTDGAPPSLSPAPVSLVGRVALRDLTLPDIERVLAYWFRSPPGFVEALGVDPAKLPAEADMRAALRDKVRDNEALTTSKLNALIVTVDDAPVGFHTLNPVVEGDHGVFHAHLWEPALRGRGLGAVTYPRACRLFFERFDLQRIVFKTPAQNTGAIRVKEKLGIRCLGDEIIGFGIIKEGTPAKVFELTRAEAERL